jgi:hypothetical protein
MSFLNVFLCGKKLSHDQLDPNSDLKCMAGNFEWKKKSKEAKIFKEPKIQLRKTKCQPLSSPLFYAKLTSGNALIKLHYYYFCHDSKLLRLLEFLNNDETFDSTKVEIILLCS